MHLHVDVVHLDVDCLGAGNLDFPCEEEGAENDEVCWAYGTQTAYRLF